MEEGMLRKRGGSNHYYLRPKLQLSSNSGAETEDEEEKEIYEHEGKKIKEEDDDDDEIYEPKRSSKKQCQEKRKTTRNDERKWEDFPIDLLCSISDKLRVVDYLNFGKVCRHWRLCFSTYKQNFMRAQSAFVLYITSNAKKSCHFYDISTGYRYGTKLPTVVRRFCIGCSSGYLILGDIERNIWVINPLTRHQLHFPNIPLISIFTGYSGDRAIFASFGSSSNFTLIVFSKINQMIWYCISSDTTSWFCLSCAEETWKILDLVVFDGRVYALTNDFRIGVFNLRSHKIWFMTLEGTPDHLSRYVRFVASKKQLLVVDFIQSFKLVVYAVDFEKMKWVEVKDLGDEHLFLGDWKSSKLGTANRGELRNCVYYLPTRSTVCYVYDINGYSRGTLPVFSQFMTTKVYCWYFLDQAYSPDNIKDEDEDDD